MPVYDHSAVPLLEKFQAASEVEAAAAREMLDYMQGGSGDRQVILALSEKMTRAHEAKMAIYKELQGLRIDT
jgi:hypothetical protein